MVPSIVNNNNTEPPKQGPHMADMISTGVGGAAGLGLIYQVNWSLVPYGESAKVIVGLALIVLGGIFYHRTPAKKEESEEKPQ